MNNLFKCVRCDRLLISEECKLHKCQIEMKRSKIIEIIFHTITKDREGNTLIITETIDGIFLTLKQFVKSKTMFKPYEFSPTFKHPSTTPDDSTEPKITKNCKIIYNLCFRNSFFVYTLDIC